MSAFSSSVDHGLRCEGRPARLAFGEALAVAARRARSYRTWVGADCCGTGGCAGGAPSDIAMEVFEPNNSASRATCAGVTDSEALGV